MSNILKLEAASIPLLAVLLACFSAAPAGAVELLTNGELSVAPMTVNDVTEASALDVWWRQSGTEQFVYNAANDRLDLDSNNNRYRGIAQVIDDSAAITTGQVEFSVNIDYQGIDGAVEVEVWGIEAGDAFSLDLGAGNNSTGPTADNTTNIDLLASSQLGSPLNANVLTNTTLTDTLDLGATDFAALALRILVHGFDTNATPTEAISINSVSLATVSAVVPEPTSVAIWSLVGFTLAGFGYDRIKRKK